jgi:hypothetical protein
MKLLPLVVVILLVTTAMGVSVVPQPSGTGGEGQAEAVDFDPSYAAQLTDSADITPRMTNVLAIPTEQIERSDLRRQYADLGPAAGFDTDTTTAQLATRAIERELDATASDAERQQRIDTELDAIEAEISRLETREQTASREFSRNEISPRVFLTELATIHRNAIALRERADMLSTQATELDDGTISTRRFQTVTYDLRMLEGPIRAHVVDVFRAERPANRIMIETGGSEIALTAIDDGQYIREITRRGLRGQGGGELSPERAEEITQQQYPILWNRSTSWSSDGSGPLFMVSTTFDRGGLRTFIDGPTERTFIEHQRLPLDTVVTGPEMTKVQDGLNVTVRQTYAGGPLRLTVTDGSAGTPLQTDVTVGQNGQESQLVGTTDQNGMLWILSPRDPFTITVFGEGNSAAFVDVTPPGPEAVTTA